MARGVNKVILVGNLGADPETRAMPSGSTVANLRIATSESWRDKTSGEQQERTEWHRVALFGRLAEIASEYLKKGSQVYIEGSLRTRKWQDKQGNERFSTEIVGNELQMLGGRGGGGGGAGAGGGGGGSGPSQRSAAVEAVAAERRWWRPRCAAGFLSRVRRPSGPERREGRFRRRYSVLTGPSAAWAARLERRGLGRIPLIFLEKSVRWRRRAGTAVRYGA